MNINTLLVKHLSMVQIDCQCGRCAASDPSVCYMHPLRRTTCALNPDTQYPIVLNGPDNSAFSVCYVTHYCVLRHPLLCSMSPVIGHPSLGSPVPDPLAVPPSSRGTRSQDAGNVITRSAAGGWCGDCWGGVGTATSLIG